MKKPDFLTMCGLTYARSNALLVEDNVERPEPAEHGFFHIARNGILFSDPSGEPFAFLVANRHNEQFFVTATRPDPASPIRYMFSTCDRHEKQLNLPESYTAKLDLARETWDSVQSQIAKLNPSAA